MVLILEDGNLLRAVHLREIKLMSGLASSRVLNFRKVEKNFASQREVDSLSATVTARKKTQLMRCCERLCFYYYCERPGAIQSRKFSKRVVSTRGQDAGEARWSPRD